MVHDEQMSGVCKVLAFYRKYKIEFQISAMVFCFIGGKVKSHLLLGVLVRLWSSTTNRVDARVLGWKQTVVCSSSGRVG